MMRISPFPRVALGAFTLAAVALPSSGYAQAPTDQVLVIINDNSVASQDIGGDYASARSVPAEHVCHVRAPAARHMSFAEYRILRDDIIVDCVCPLINAGSRPAVCGAPTQTDIQAAITEFIPLTPIRFFVVTQGMPFFFLYPVSCSGSSASLENNLSHDLVSDEGVLRTDGALCMDGPRTSYYFADGPPRLDPAVHGVVAGGRLEADTTALAKQLVRRAMLAEQDGFSGRWHFNRSWASYMDTETAYYDAHAAFLDGDACLPFVDPSDYTVVNVPDYNASACTATFTQSQIPSATIPIVDAASVYLGSYQNTGFGSWDNFVKWRIDAGCDPGTIDDPNYAWDPVTGEAVPGGCVGVLLGFIGNQFGSFTCDKARLAPTYWQGMTASPLQIPALVDGVAHTGTHSIRFGTIDEVASPQPGPALQRFGIEMEIDNLTPSSVTVFEQGTVGLWVRTEGLSAVTMAVNTSIRWTDTTSSSVRCSPNLALPADTAGAWVELTCPLDNTGETREVDRLALQLTVNDFTGLLYVDDVSFTIPVGGDLLAARNPSFEEGKRDAAGFRNQGNWCIGWNSLLGGTAMFGSVSHWMTNGWSHRHRSTLHGLLADRVLGELVWGSQSTVGSAALIGDPIYEPPLAVELRVDVADGLIDYTTPLTVDLIGSARNGRRGDLWSAVSYTIDYGEGTDPAAVTAWVTDGISLSQGGAGARDDELVATWDTRHTTSAAYVVRLVATLPWGNETNDVAAYTMVTVDRRCIPNPCVEANRSGCVEIDDELVICECDPGFIEDGDGNCADDPCDPSPCIGPNRHCEVDAGGAACLCDDGFIDIAGACVADACNPNPCTVPLRTVCSNDAGSASCGCDVGFIEDGDGRCVEDVCATDPCTAPNQSICVNDNGSAICLCDDGHFYDGGDTCVPEPEPNGGVDSDRGCGCRGGDGGAGLLLALLPLVTRRRRIPKPSEV